jgi:hypothetical protein
MQTRTPSSTVFLGTRKVLSGTVFSGTADVEYGLENPPKTTVLNGIDQSLEASFVIFAA